MRQPNRTVKGGSAYDRMGIADIAVEGSDVVSYQANSLPLMCGGRECRLEAIELLVGNFLCVPP